MYYFVIVALFLAFIPLKHQSPPANCSTLTEFDVAPKNPRNESLLDVVINGIVSSDSYKYA